MAASRDMGHSDGPVLEVSDSRTLRSKMGTINVTPTFVLAGEATFTVDNGSGKHYTYKVWKSEPT